MAGIPKVSPEAFAARHAERLNYTLVKVLAPRKFRVKCNACGELRDICRVPGIFGHRCECSYKRKFWTKIRTAKTHTEELHELGYTEYECLKVEKVTGVQFQVSPSTYKHNTCGHVFTKSWNGFKNTRIPCPKCQKGGYVTHHDKYVAKVGKKTKNIEVIGTYKDFYTRLEHRYVKCGHVVEHKPESILAGKSCFRCPICYPTLSWHSFRVKGKFFRTRSLTEKNFIKWLVREKKVPVDSIEYEPESCKIEYYDFFRNDDRIYTPDFKVGKTCIEIKDLGSLGIQPNYRWEKNQDKVLIENYSKFVRAVTQFDDYRIYVYVKGTFHRVYDFWNRKEQERLLALAT